LNDVPVAGAMRRFQIDSSEICRIGGGRDSPSVYTLSTDHTLTMVLGEGYFDKCFGALRQRDFVLVAACDQPAVLAVARADAQSVVVVRVGGLA
jgi:hypothetical protein